MSNPTITFIGAGNMAAALIGGLIADGTEPQAIVATDPDQSRRRSLAQTAGIQTLADNSEAVTRADIVVLAVKPQILEVVARDIAEAVQAHRPLVISIAAGVHSDTLQRWLGGDIALVRSMPNTPAMLQTGATALFATAAVDDEQRNQAESVMRAVGLAQWVEDEALMDAVTALSGSGPAYFFLVMEAMETAGVQLGLPAESARLLTLQTALGAARMAIESTDDPATLRQKVTSPGGTTEQALRQFEQDGLRAMFARALTAARDRSVELSRQLDNPQD